MRQSPTGAIVWKLCRRLADPTIPGSKRWERACRTREPRPDIDPIRRDRRLRSLRGGKQLPAGSFISQTSDTCAIYGMKPEALPTLTAVLVADDVSSHLS